MAEAAALHDLTAAAGAVFIEEAGWLLPASYGDPGREYESACRHAALFDLSHRGKIEAAGPEAVAFLHNLCTNDVRGLPVGRACETFFTTAKAKVIGHGMIHRLAPETPGAVLIDTDPGLGPGLYKHLDHYLVSERLGLHDRTRDLAHLHLCGPQVESILKGILGEKFGELSVLQTKQAALPAGGNYQVCRRDPLGLPGFDLIAPAEAAAHLWQQLTEKGVRPAGLTAYHTLRIEAGTPQYGIDLDETRAAYEVGRTQQAISYTKGCYLGQEPIVMARDRGHVNRTLTGLRLAGPTPVPAGARVVRGGQEVGQVTSSVFSPRLQTPIALAYLRRGSWEAGTEVEVALDGECRTAVVATLPFVVTQTAK
jgi:folate-binding protein YgfZ